jgi:phosphonate transport system permease protein
MTSEPGASTAAPADRFPASVSKSSFGWLLAAAFVATLAASARLAQVDPRVLVRRESLANVATFVGGMFPPRLDADFLGQMVGPALETIQISVMGMVIAVAIGFPIGLCATSSLAWRGVLHERVGPLARWLLGIVPYALARAVLSVLRSIPEYVWAFMFVRAVGLGPFPGVLAIGVAYGGMLGKVYSEILEGVNPRPLEALHAAGGSRLGLVAYGLVPEALPHLVSYTLYRWECAIRASAILGFVGAGGLGQQLELSMRMFQFDEVVTLLAMLLVLVASVDLISARVRARMFRRA